MQAGHYPVSYDPAKSRELLKQAGYTPGPDGIMQKNGQRLSFTLLMLSGDEHIEQMIVELQAELRAVGIQAKIREIEFNQMLSLLDTPGPGWEAAGLAMTM
jgi:peptide/nickel transport system substrate-binding protein